MMNRKVAGWVVVALALAGLAAPIARGQVSYEEAMRRLQERQAARQRAAESAATQPATAPATAPVATRPATAPAERVIAPRPKARVAADAPPPAPREFRGVWVASVNNAQWPSVPGLPVDQLKKEMTDILDRCVALRLNAVVLQVRPCADALYPSTLEPWSEYLTGTQGQAPSPMWDPLQTWIDEAHKRGLELHAWFNPYRVKHPESKSPTIADTSIAKTHPEVVKQYGGYLWMDPGEPVAQEHTLAVLADLVQRYDIDGIHTDDYYYPYKARENGKEVDFPDDPSYQRYQQSGGKLARDDWRRDNINHLVERIYTTTHKLKPWVKVGYGPFGIWKSGVPAGIKGLSMYDALYADAKLWLNKGWLDYLSPQLYWKIGGPQDFASLLNWWASENTAHRHLWPGMSLGRHPPAEVLAQIDLTRHAPGTSPGQLFWHINNLAKRPELADALAHGPYAEPALVPASPWLGRSAPPAPTVTAQRDGTDGATLTLSPAQGKPPTVYAVWTHSGGNWSFTTLPGTSSTAALQPTRPGQPITAAVVTAVDRFGAESPRVTATVP